MHYKIVTGNKFNIDMNPSLNESQFTRFVKTLSAINWCFYKASLIRLLWRMCILLFIIFIQIQIFLSGTSGRHGGLCHNSPDKTGAMCSISNISNWCHSGQILELCQNNFWFENIFVCQQVRHAVILILIFVKVMRWIRDTEAMLIASFTIPGCLQEAEQLKKEHEQFQVAIEVC